MRSLPWEDPKGRNGGLESSDAPGHARGSRGWPVRVAVFTLTRDRIDYTRHCFQQLAELAGCNFDHFVLDQGSQDGTGQWLRSYYQPTGLITLDHNVGISRGTNLLLDLMRDEHDPYDVIVKVDNDCELVTDGALADAAYAVACEPNWLLSPTIMGLWSPVPISGETKLAGGLRVGATGMIGGIFLAAHRSVYDQYRPADSNPAWGMDDVQICGWVHAHGGHTGYLLDQEAWHHETTVGQNTRYPEYLERKLAEMAG